MTGDTPDDVEARRAHNKKAAAESIAAALHTVFEVPSSPELAMPGTPSQQSYVPPRDVPRMSDLAYNGQYRELRADVENLKTNFADLRHDIDARFKEQAAESRDMHREMLERIDKNNDSQNSNKLTVEKAATVIFGAISLVLTLVWGYSTLTQASITDKITFTNDKIARNAVTTSDDVTRIEKSIGLLTDTLAKRADKVDDRFERFEANTVPRREADNRFERDEQVLTRKVDKDVFAKTTEYRDDQIASLRTDVANLLRDTQKRADLDARFQDFVKRIDLISNRVESLQATSAGTAILQEQLREVQSQIKEIREQLLVVPHYGPKMPVQP